MKAKWENEKNAIGKVQSLREQIEQTNADIEKAQREYDLNKAAELKYGKLPQLQKQLEEEEKIAAAKKEDSLLRDRVTDEEIARIVARWTGIPWKSWWKASVKSCFIWTMCCTAVSSVRTRL